VLSSWQIRALRILTSRPALALLTVLLFSVGWISGQAARVPLLKREVATLTTDLERVDSLTKTLEQLQANYERLQAMLGAGAAASDDRAPARAPSTTSSRSQTR
jgi:predicted PurR-regulated permease PerM